nr:hypothetical protein [Lysobacter enzymogenes]
MGSVAEAAGLGRDQHAARAGRAGGEALGERVEQAREGFARRQPGRRQHAAVSAPELLQIALQRGAEQVFLAAEGGIEARRGDADGGSQLAHRGGFEAALPEHPHRGFQGLIAVEAARATAWAARFRRGGVGGGFGVLAERRLGRGCGQTRAAGGFRMCNAEFHSDRY